MSTVFASSVPAYFTDEQREQIIRLWRKHPRNEKIWPTREEFAETLATIGLENELAARVKLYEESA